jgi:hypothetical protein
VVKAYEVLFARSERKWSPGRAGCGLENNIETDSKAIWCEGVDRIHLAQDKVHYGMLGITVVNLHVS